MRDIKNEEKYTFVVRDGKNKDQNWRISLLWLKQHLQIPDMKFFSNVYQMEWKFNRLEKTVDFLLKLHEPQIIEYFYFKMFQFVKDRSKKYHASFVKSKVDCFGLFEERVKAWDKLIEDGVIIDCKKGGWYETESLKTKKRM